MIKVDVIIPVGPGHEKVARRAAASVTVAMDNAAALDMHPQMRVVLMEDHEGKLGRSRARNQAAQESDAEWIFWLDADDMMHPDCWPGAVNYLSEYEAVWGMCHQLEADFILPRYELPNIRDRATLLRHHPMSTIKIGHFVRRECAIAHPFDEDMDCGEDWDYYLRIWDACKCIKVPEPMYIKVRGEHSTGPRSATGRQWSETVERMLAEARGA